MKKVLSIITLAGFLGACGSTDFSGNTAAKNTSDAQAAKGDEPGADGSDGPGASNGSGGPGDSSVAEPGGDDPASVTGGTPEVGSASPDERSAIEACSKAWGEEAPGSFESVRKITANISILGGGSLIDNRKTEQPELTLVLASVNILSKLDWKLLNPNGWYCIVANVNVLSSLTVTIDKNAHLADSQVAVDILSSSDGAVGAANVNVLSSVRVIEQ